MTKGKKNDSHPIAKGGRGRAFPGMMFFTRALLACTSLGAVGGGLALAQSTGRGNITGTVTDQSGAVVPGAAVVAADIATGVTTSATTNTTGYYEIDSLDAGTYKITVTAPGFEQLIRNGIVLNASNVIQLPLTVSIGRSTEAVTVTADAPLLNTESGLNGQSLTTRELQSVPMSGDNPMQLAELAPGVESPAGISQLYTMDGTLSWNGVSKFGTAGVTDSNEFDVDGAANEGNGRGNLISMNSDMADQVRIDTSDFDPTAGHTFGVTVTETTKSGTNMLHGSATELYNNRRWAAMTRFQALTYEHEQYINGCVHGPSTSPQCYQDENTYGWPGVHENLTTYGIGGPVFIPKLYDGRNKFFWFVAGANDIWTDASETSATIPTVQERSGNFSDLPTASLPANYAATFNAACGTGTPYYGQYQLYNPYSVTMINGHPSRTPLCGNVVPASLMQNSAMAKLINSWLPTPTNTNVTGGNYLYTSTQPQTFRQFTTREDYAFSDNDRVFLRFTRHHYTKDQPGIAPNGIDTQQGPKWAEIGALGWNHVFNRSVNLDVTLEGSNLETSDTSYPGYSAFPPASVGLPSYLQQYAGGAATLPELQFGGGSTYAQGGSGANSSLFGNLNDAPNLYRTAGVRGNLTIIHAVHSFRIGGEWRAQHYSRPVQGLSSGDFNFDDTFTQENDGTNLDCVGCSSSNNLGLPSASDYGLSYAAFLMGVPTTAEAQKQAPLAINTPYFAFYFGDTWRIKPRLTIMPGIRYEYEFGPAEDHNYQISEFDPNQSLAIAAPAQAAYTTTYANATAAEQAAMPSTIAVQGGPLYAGVNGAPTRQWRNDYRLLPRLGFSYQIKPNTVIRGGYGIFFDTLNALEWPGPTDQTNFTATTTDSTSSYYGNFGQNLSPATPPIANPFPTTNESNFLAAVGPAAGNLSYVGASPTIYPQFLVPARAQRVSASLQHQIGSSLMIEVGYIGSWSSHMSNISAGLVNAGGGANTNNQNLASVPASFFAGGNEPSVASNSILGQQVTNPFHLANFSALQSSNPAAYNQMSHSGTFTNPTTAISNLVRPYPFMGGLSEDNPIGQSHFQELQVLATQRMSHGFNLMAVFEKNYQYDRDYFANPFDTQMSWEPSNSSYPWRLTAEGVYELPFGRGKMWANSGWKSAAFGGFHLNGTYEFNPGPLLEFGNMFYVGNINASNILLKHPIYNQNIVSGVFNVQWLDPGNVVAAVNTDGSCTYSGTGFVTNASCQPNGYNLRAFPTRVNGVRQQTIDTVQANVQRAFRIREGVSFEARFDVYDLFNHQILGVPNLSPTNSQFGLITSSAGANGAGNARWLDIQGHIRF
jgi:Carboxypeptidase regulatory-like domain